MAPISSRIPFSPQRPFRPVRPQSTKIIFISCEGAVTEEEYFERLTDIYCEVKSKIQFVSVAEDAVNTRMFFDMIDRRYRKDCPHTTIFTSNKQPDQWQEYFSEDDTLLCTLDRIFDNATVYMFKGDSYRGGGLKTLGIEAGKMN